MPAIPGPYLAHKLDEDGWQIRSHVSHEVAMVDRLIGPFRSDDELADTAALLAASWDMREAIRSLVQLAERLILFSHSADIPFDGAGLEPATIITALRPVLAAADAYVPAAEVIHQVTPSPMLYTDYRDEVLANNPEVKDAYDALEEEHKEVRERMRRLTQ